MKSVGLKTLGTTAFKAADQAAITSTTAVAVLTMAIPAAGTYRFDAKLLCTTGATTTGIRPSVTGPAGTLAYRTETPITATTSTLSFNAAGAAAASIAGTNIVLVEGVLVATAAGTLSVLIASSAASTSIVPKVGSLLEVIQLA